MSISTLDIELSHIVLLVMTSMFGLGVMGEWMGSK